MPGSPTIVPRNMPGAGSFLAVNRVHSTLPKDGTVIGLGAPTLALDEKLGSQGVRFKTAELKLAWTRRFAHQYCDDVEDLAGEDHRGCAEDRIDPLGHRRRLAPSRSIRPCSTNVIGTKFKLVMGYRGSNEAMLAMERGEVEGHSTAWSAVKVAKPDWVRDKTVSIIVQFALKRQPRAARRPDRRRARPQRRRAPGARRHHECERGRHRLFFTGPGVPPDRLAVLRHAFDETVKDPEFLAEAQRIRLGVHPDDRRGAAKAGGAGQQPVARAPGEGPRGLSGERELRGVNREWFSRRYSHPLTHCSRPSSLRRLRLGIPRAELAGCWSRSCPGGARGTPSEDERCPMVTMVVLGSRLHQHPVEFGLELLVERRGRFVQQQPVGLLEQRTGDRQALLLAAGEALRPNFLAVELVRQRADPGIGERPADVLVLVSIRFARIRNGGTQCSNRDVGLLRHHHHLGAIGNMDAAFAERPDAGDRTEQRRFFLSPKVRPAARSRRPRRKGRAASTMRRPSGSAMPTPSRATRVLPPELACVPDR